MIELSPDTITRSADAPSNIERLADYNSKPAAIARRSLKAWTWPNRYASQQAPGSDYDNELAEGFALKYG